MGVYRLRLSTALSFRLIFIGLIVGLAVASLAAAKRGDWETVYLPAANRLLAGEDIYQRGYFYPPFQALAAVPFAMAPRLAARIAWAALNALASAVFLLCAWRITGGASFMRGDSLRRHDVIVAAVGLAASLGFIFDAITNGQTDLIIAALVALGCLLSMQGRAVAGGGAIGIAASAKVTPLLFLGWFAGRSRFNAILVLLGTTIALNLVPDLFFAQESTSHLLVWARRVLAPLFGYHQPPGAWYTAPEFNHSLAGLYYRLLPTALLRPVWLGSAVLVVAITAFVLAIARKRHPASAFQMHEIGAIACLMLLLSPAASKPHFCLLLLPAWAVARSARDQRDHFAIAILVASVVCGLFANKDLVGAAIYDSLKWWGVITLEALLLWVASIRALLRAHPVLHDSIELPEKDL